MSVNAIGAGVSAPAAAAGAAPASNGSPQLSRESTIRVLATLGQANVTKTLQILGPDALPPGARQFTLLSPQARTALQVPDDAADQIIALAAARANLEKAKERRDLAFARIEQIAEKNPAFVQKSLLNYQQLHAVENSLLLAKSHAASLPIGADQQASNDAINTLMRRQSKLKKAIIALKRVNNWLDTRVALAANSINCSEDNISERRALIAALKARLEE